MDILNDILSQAFFMAKYIIPFSIAFAIFRVSLRYFLATSRSDVDPASEQPRSKVSLKKDIPKTDPCKLPESNTNFIRLN